MELDLEFLVLVMYMAIKTHNELYLDLIGDEVKRLKGEVR